MGHYRERERERENASFFLSHSRLRPVPHTCLTFPSGGPRGSIAQVLVPGVSRNEIGNNGCGFIRRDEGGLLRYEEG